MIRVVSPDRSLSDQLDSRDCLGNRMIGTHMAEQATGRVEPETAEQATEAEGTAATATAARVTAEVDWEAEAMPEEDRGAGVTAGAAAAQSADLSW